MGRTLPTAAMTLQAEEERWKLFRRALRKEDQEAFDSLWRAARRQAAAEAMSGRAVPLDAMLMAMLTGLERRVLDLERRLREMHDEKTGGLGL